MTAPNSLIPPHNQKGTDEMSEQANDGVREVVALLGELLDGPSSGEFYGIGPGLRNKLETIRLTALRSPSPVGTEDIGKRWEGLAGAPGCKHCRGKGWHMVTVDPDLERDEPTPCSWCLVPRAALEAIQSIAPRTAVDAVADEREACALKADAEYRNLTNGYQKPAGRDAMTAFRIAAAIRARSNPEIEGGERAQ